MPNKKIIAIVGMAGSGKSEAIKYLKKEYNWPNVYFGQATFDRIKKDGLKLNYRNERSVREKIREEMGMGAYAILALPKIKKLLKKNKVVLAESLYSWDEYKIMKKEFGNDFILIAIYASPSTREKRLYRRQKERPMHSHKEFITRDYTEIENLAKGGPIAMADFTVINEDSRRDFYKNMEKIIAAAGFKS